MSALKTVVRGAYDIQKLRIQMGNRIVANFKARLGQDAGVKEEDLDKEDQDIIKMLRTHYKKITDGVKTFPRQKSFKGDKLISDFTELCLLHQYTELEKSEAQHFRKFESILQDYPLWTNYLENVRGIGPALAGVLITEIDITKAKYPSSLWMYSGLDVCTKDNKGRTNHKEHLVDVEYTDKNGKKQTKKSITYNPFLKTKLIGVLGPSLLRAGNQKYSKAYYDYKNRIENIDAHKDKTKGHRNNMAIRYMVKRFLVDLHIAWRGLENLPVATEYNEGVLGHVHSKQ